MLLTMSQSLPFKQCLCWVCCTILGAQNKYLSTWPPCNSCSKFAAFFCADRSKSRHCSLHFWHYSQVNKGRLSKSSTFYVCWGLAQFIIFFLEKWIDLRFLQPLLQDCCILCSQCSCRCSTLRLQPGCLKLASNFLYLNTKTSRQQNLKLMKRSPSPAGGERTALFRIYLGAVHIRGHSGGRNCSVSECMMCRGDGCCSEPAECEKGAKTPLASFLLLFLRSSLWKVQDQKKGKTKPLCPS